MIETNNPQIISLTYTPENVERTPKDHFARVPLKTAKLIENYGIEGDRKGGHPKRQVNIMSAATLDKLSAEGCKIQPGEMGEQMIVRGMAIDSLPVGTLLQLGESAVLEVTTPRTGCDRLEHIQNCRAEDVNGQLGVLSRVIRGGVVSIGDAVRVVQPAEVDGLDA